MAEPARRRTTPEVATADPWLEQSSEPGTSVIVVDVSAADAQAEEATSSYPCPHCGTLLVPHGDAAGSLHCYGSECVGCCFFPPESVAPDLVRERLGARPCPKATAGF